MQTVDIQITMKKIFLLAALTFIYFYCPAQFRPAEKIMLPGSGLENLYRVDQHLYRSEQPGKEDFALLEKLGVREVINMRKLHKDDDKAVGTNLRLHHIPVNTGRLNIEQLTEALRIIRDATGPVLMHCWHGSDRTGAVVAMYRIVFQGVTKEKAVREMTSGGFGFHAVYSPIALTIMEADIDAIRRELGITAP